MEWEWVLLITWILRGVTGESVVSCAYMWPMDSWVPAIGSSFMGQSLDHAVDFCCRCRCTVISLRESECNRSVQNKPFFLFTPYCISFCAYNVVLIDKSLCEASSKQHMGILLLQVVLRQLSIFFRARLTKVFHAHRILTVATRLRLGYE